MARRALVTGSAGFIGFHQSLRLLDEGWEVMGLDAMTDYYDPRLKRRRRALLEERAGYAHVEDRLETPGLLDGLMARHRPEIVIHLAAQAGVRYSIEEPRSYVTANLLGTFELLEAARAHPPAHLLLASTSSVYGANTRMPYAETDRADHPLSFYAATKKSTEAMAHSYAHLFEIPVTMFRFFTVYGPWGRPDMALFKFVRAIREGRPIDVYNEGRMKRDFTYVDDLVEGVSRLIGRVPPGPDGRNAAPAIPGDSLSPVAPWRVVNIGLSRPVELTAFIDTIEDALQRKAERRLLPMQPGDVRETWADTDLLHALVGTIRETPLEKGVSEFVRWYVDVYETLD